MFQVERDALFLYCAILCVGSYRFETVEILPDFTGLPRTASCRSHEVIGPYLAQLRYDLFLQLLSCCVLVQRCVEQPLCLVCRLHVNSPENNRISVDVLPPSPFDQRQDLLGSLFSCQDRPTLGAGVIGSRAAVRRFCPRNHRILFGQGLSRYRRCRFSSQARESACGARCDVTPPYL